MSPGGIAAFGLCIVYLIPFIWEHVKGKRKD